MPEITSEHPIAFLCAEFALESRLPTYAGGLGVLSGDYLKEMADKRIPVVAVGLLYRGEGAIQTIDSKGIQVEVDMHFDPLSSGLEHVYLNDMPLFIKVHLTQANVWVRCWKKQIGESVTLYLLDTETDQNHLSERGISHALYAGTEEEIIKQQLILGIGGAKLLHTLGIHPSVYHVNEGRPAFIHWQLIRHNMFDHGLEYEEAVQRAREKTVYTNHTLVEAGNQSYDLNLLKAYGKYYSDKIGISPEMLLESGLYDDKERFSVTRMGLNISRRSSAVSQLHYKFCQEKWPGFDWVGVTNGVHMPTWQAPRVRDADLGTDQLWHSHQESKRSLAHFVQNQTGYGFDPNRMIISWARRIASYKQLDKLFDDIERLRSILKNFERPVQLLVAGKAHIYDTASKQTIQRVVHYMSRELAGSALFIPNYNMDVAKMLVTGSDLWLNTPKLGLEASGTSGMKAMSNGVLQLSVNDGWVAEVDWEGLGWMLDDARLSEHFYELMEQQIVPMYYNRDAQGVPREWLERMKKSVSMSGQFSSSRMVDEYVAKLYG